MTTKQRFYNKVTNSKKDLIEEFLKILKRGQVSYCVIGGVAINAYCEAMVTLDFDCVVIIEQKERLKSELQKRGFRLKTHPHTWEITHRDSDIRIQIQRDERYQGFIKKARPRQVMGYSLQVAHQADLLQSKLWAYQDRERDELKRDKDLLDIKRLLRSYPSLKKLLPETIRKKI